MIPEGRAVRVVAVGAFYVLVCADVTLRLARLVQAVVLAHIVSVNTGGLSKGCAGILCGSPHGA